MLYIIFRLIVVQIFLSCTFSYGMNIQLGGQLGLGRNSEWSFEFKPVSKSNDGRSKDDGEHIVSIRVPDAVSKLLEAFVLKNQKEVSESNQVNNRVSEAKLTKMTPYIITATKKAAVYKITAYDKITTTVKPIYVRAKKVKQDSQISEFINHLYKQAMKVFESIKQKATDEKMKNEVDFLARSYEEKFGNFVRDTLNQKIKTRLGRQKVIINTMDTSNRIMKRLINYLIGTDKKLLRTEVAANVFQNEMTMKTELETKHICKKFGICRSLDGFSNFVTELMTIGLCANDKKFKELTDAFTEAIKYADFSRIMNKKTHKRFLMAVTDIELMSAGMQRALLHIIKNIITNRNKPIEVIGKVDKRINQTVGVLEMIEAFEVALPPDEKNRLEWQDLKRRMIDWKDGKREDTLEIMQSFTDHIIHGVNKFSDQSAADVQRDVNMVLGYMYPGN